MSLEEANDYLYENICAEQTDFGQMIDNDITFEEFNEKIKCHTLYKLTLIHCLLNPTGEGLEKDLEKSIENEWNNFKENFCEEE